MEGATIANYVELKEFIRDRTGTVTAAILYDRLNKKEFKVEAKTFINTAGVHADSVRKMANPAAIERMLCSRGAHLMLPHKLLPDYKGIIVPDTTDGRLIFVINYLGKAMAGTSDAKCDPSFDPTVVQEDADLIVENIKHLFPDLKLSDFVDAKFSGIRPLVLPERTVQLHQDFDYEGRDE